MNLLSANIANAETPNYKARDIDFRAAMTQASNSQESTQLRATQAKHMTGFESQLGVESDIKYRQPSSLQENGNTVETHREHAEFMENAIKYQASLNLLDSRIKGLRAAIKGE
jgi:flagellar basal-body rod protein FlgB